MPPTPRSHGAHIAQSPAGRAGMLSAPGTKGKPASHTQPAILPRVQRLSKFPWSTHSIFEELCPFYSIKNFISFTKVIYLGPRLADDILLNHFKLF